MRAGPFAGPLLLSEEDEIMLLIAILACTECVDWFLCYWYGYC